MSHYTIDEVRQITPAPEWRVRWCYAHGEEAEFQDVPVIGWAVVRRRYYRSDKLESAENLVDILVYFNGEEQAMTVRELNDFLFEAKAFIIPPGVTRSDEDLKQETLRYLEWKKQTKDKRAKEVVSAV